MLRHATVAIAAASFIVSVWLIHEAQSKKDQARSFIRQGEARAVSAFKAPLAFFYGDYLGGMYVESLDFSAVRNPLVLEAMQGMCYSDSPKHVISVPPRTWGEEFASGATTGMHELKETLSLYEAYMTPEELHIVDTMQRDPVVHGLLSSSDFSYEQNNPLVVNGSCSGLRPTGEFKRYIDDVAELQVIVDKSGT